MDIAKTNTQSIVFINREAQRAVHTITLVSIVGQVGIVGLKIVIEQTAAETNAVNREVGVGQ